MFLWNYTTEASEHKLVTILKAVEERVTNDVVTSLRRHWLGQVAWTVNLKGKANTERGGAVGEVRVGIKREGGVLKQAKKADAATSTVSCATGIKASLQ